MQGTDVQMKLLNMSLQMAVQKVKVPGDQTNKLFSEEL